MTLALYGKTRRRQGILVMLGLFAVFAALIGGRRLRQNSQASTRRRRIHGFPPDVPHVRSALPNG
ncbi:hypothetical protein [Candidatus Amarobacter glycogenicus]|uniref:hypothetical protein n=1 Tax=Candidatus Amarobacter glycogenicus TaxID=3140699 RepID=UPI002A145E58|nr:hypothetical protein [Dehalococcoidia bacterium]